jgi:hypothetical protein
MGSAGTYDLSGTGELWAGDLHLAARGSGQFVVTGGEASIDVGAYYQKAAGTLISRLDATGLATIRVSGEARCHGPWYVEDVGAGFGRFDVLSAAGGLFGRFDQVVLPDDETWSCGVEDGTLWVRHVPEPAVILLAGAGLVWLLRRRRPGGRFVWAVVCVASLAAWAGPAARADDVYWTCDPATTGDWHDPANWDVRVPGEWDDANVDNGGTVELSSGAAEAYQLLIDSAPGGSGSLAMTGGTLNIGHSLEVGKGGDGRIVHSGGTAAIHHNLNIASGIGATGGYELSGLAVLDVDDLAVGSGGIGEFRQSGGIASTGLLFVGGGDTGVGTYELSGGQLASETVRVGDSGMGRFVHTGGVHLVTDKLRLASEFGGVDDGYELSGTGDLRAAEIEIRRFGRMTQTGGSCNAGYVHVEPMGEYLFTGGSFTTTSMLLEGKLDFGGSAASMAVAENGLVDCSNGIIANAGSASMAVGANSLVIFPSLFDPATDLGGIGGEGLWHRAGTTLVVPAGKGFVGSGSLYDHVECAGTIGVPPGEGLSLEDGLMVTGAGDVDLGTGRLLVADQSSGISGGRFAGRVIYVGGDQQGRFVQTGGTVESSVKVGNPDTSRKGIYELRDGALSGGSLSVGNRSVGEFIQSGGTCSFTNVFHLGGSGNGICRISGGEFAIDYQYVGDEGRGRFIQSGGRNSGFRLNLGHGHYSSDGSYELSGGELAMAFLDVGEEGNGSFTQTGGSSRVTAELYVARRREGSYALSRGTCTVDGRLRMAGHTNATAMFALSGTGHLSAGEEYVGVVGTATFAQSGGTNTVGLLNIGPTGRYVYTGGTLNFTDGLYCAGEFSFAGAAVGLNVPGGTIANFGAGTIADAGSASITGQPGCLVIFPSAFDPYSDLAAYDNPSGLTHVLGSELFIPAGVSFSTSMTIEDHVRCEGTLQGIGPAGVTLKRGVTVAGDGVVDLERGTLTVEDAVSGMSGGQLKAHSVFVGRTGMGTFAQGAGDHHVEDELIVGDEVGSSGRYQLGGGTLVTRAATIGRFGTGRLVQTGGELLLQDYAAGVFVLAEWMDSEGTYELQDGRFEARTLVVGKDGRGHFEQSGGVAVLAGGMSVGRGSGGRPDGTCHVSGGRLETPYLTISDSGGQGAFVQTAGQVVVAGNLSLARNYGGTSRYDLAGGQLSAQNERVGESGTFVFAQTGGVNTVGGNLDLAFFSGANATYELGGDGWLSSAALTVGRSGEGLFRHTGGINTVAGTLCLGLIENSAGTYELSGGSLSASQTIVGDAGAGQFVQSGGRHSVRWQLLIPGDDARSAGYTLSGGMLSAGDLSLGFAGTGTWEVTGSADITINNALRFGAGATFTAVPGTVIHMAGASLTNQATDPAALAGLGAVHMVFEGASPSGSRFEVAGKDLGIDHAGLADNFALSALSVGNQAPAQLTLVDTADNLPGAEALYVHNLHVGPEATLNLNRYPLYYRHGHIDPAATILGGIPMRMEGLGKVVAEGADGGFAAFCPGEHGKGVLALWGDVDLRICWQSAADLISGVSIDLSSSLLEDLSSDGLARGRFTGGTVRLDQGAHNILLADIVEFHLAEAGDGSGTMTAWGHFEYVDGTLGHWFGTDGADILQLSLDLCGLDVADFSGVIAASGDITFRPIPEPAALALLGMGAAALIRRRRSRRSGR